MDSKLLQLSSISKKLIMALAGLFLIVFLLVHLTINLMLLLDDGGLLYSKAVKFMTSNILIKIVEIFLFGGLIIHILIGIILQIKNWFSRPVKYYVMNKSKTPFFSKYMIWTGLIILIFLIIHFMNFYFVKLGFVKPPLGVDVHDFYTMSILLFSNKIYSIIYIVLLVLLGFHLNHAFQSSFQTLGFNHNRYTPALKIIATIYSIVVAGGFIVIPLYIMFIYN
jgi:succinate dehydrogenase / fumarate reductase, cytochrome b subunit